MDSSGNNKINNNIFTQKYNFSEVNPFNGNFNPESPVNKNEKNSVSATNPVKRINGYDSTILNLSNSDESESEELSLDYRIKEKEGIIKDLDGKIKVADNYGTQNEALGLKAKRQRIFQELDSLRKQQLYGGRVLGEVPKAFHEDFKQKMPFIYKVQSFVSRQVIRSISCSGFPLTHNSGGRFSRNTGDASILPARSALRNNNGLCSKMRFAR